MSKINAVTLGLHLLEVEITTRCDLDCLHCYNRTNKEQNLPLSDIIGLLDFAENKGVSKFIISGGEAAKHPAFQELAKILKARRPNLKLVIQSNGSIGQVDLEKVRAFDIVHLSFDAEDSGVRDISVAGTLDTAKRFLAAGIYTYLFSTVHPGNVDKIDYLVDLANKNRVDIGFNLCVPGNNKQLRLSREERLETIKKLHSLYIAKKTPRFTSPLAAVLKGQETESYVGIKGGCTAGIAACVVLPNGDVVPCPFFRLKAGNIYENDLESIWLSSEMFSQLRRRPSFRDPCGTCRYLSYCGGCRARAYGENHDLAGSDPDCIL
ncbi:MAG: radical SAM protein [Patescibacteria group bacterium]